MTAHWHKQSAVAMEAGIDRARGLPWVLTKKKHLPYTWQVPSKKDGGLLMTAHWHKQSAVAVVAGTDRIKNKTWV